MSTFLSRLLAIAVVSVSGLTSIAFADQNVADAPTDLMAPSANRKVIMDLRVGGSMSSGALTGSGGGSTGIAAKYMVSPTLGIGGFWDGHMGIGLSTGSFNLGQNYGAEIGFLTSPQSKVRWEFGAKLGRFEGLGIGWFFLPVNAGTVSSWSIGPKMTLRAELSSWFSLGLNLDVSYILPTTVSVVGIGGGNTATSGFLLGSVGLNLGFHMF